MDKDSKQVVVLLTHPNIKESRANKALMDAISDMGEVAIYNLYEMRMEDAFNAEISNFLFFFSLLASLK